MKYYGCLEELSETDERRPLYEAQRKERGFDDSECWNLDNTLAQFLVPRLKVFKENTNSYPGTLESEEWDAILQEMIDGFEIAANPDLCYGEDEENNKKRDRAVHLLSEYFNHLWD